MSRFFIFLRRMAIFFFGSPSLRFQAGGRKNLLVAAGAFGAVARGEKFSKGEKLHGHQAESVIYLLEF